MALGHLYEESNGHLRAQLISLQRAEAWRLLSGNFVVEVVTCTHVPQGPPNLWTTVLVFLNKVQQRSETLLLIFIPQPDIFLSVWTHF